MMAKNADNVLDMFIDELKSGERTLEASLWSLSRHESRLASALKIAAHINSVCKTVAPDPTRQQVTRERIMAVAEQRCWESGVERSSTRKISREKKQLFNMGRLASQFGAVALALTVASGASVAMAAESLPGSSLYPVKRAAESVRLALTLDNEARGKLLLTIAQERTEELNRLGAKSPYRNSLVSEIKEDINAVKQLANDPGAVGIAPALDEFIKENARVLNGVEESLEIPSAGKSGKGAEQAGTSNAGTSNAGTVATPSSIVPGNVKATSAPVKPPAKNEINTSNDATSKSKTEHGIAKPKKSVVTPGRSTTIPAVKPDKNLRPSESATTNGKASAPSKNSGDVKPDNAQSDKPSTGNKDTGGNSSSNSNSSNNSVNSNSSNSDDNSSDNSSKSAKDKAAK